MSKKTDLKYESDPNFKGIEINEPNRGNSFIGIRKIRWKPEDDFKIDLRRYVVRVNDGDVYPSKGISMEDDIADKVTEGMVDLGYGNTTNLLTSLFDREDFEDGLKNLGEHEAKKSAKDFLDNILSVENAIKNGDLEVKEF